MVYNLRWKHSGRDFFSEKGSKYPAIMFALEVQKAPRSLSSTASRKLVYSLAGALRSLDKIGIVNWPVFGLSVEEDKATLHRAFYDRSSSNGKKLVGPSASYVYYVGSICLQVVRPQMTWTYRVLNDYIGFALQLRQLAQFIVLSFERAAELTAAFDIDIEAGTGIQLDGSDDQHVGGVQGLGSDQATNRGSSSGNGRHLPFRKWFKKY